jgi:hypothetical protein
MRSLFSAISVAFSSISRRKKAPVPPPPDPVPDPDPGPAPRANLLYEEFGEGVTLFPNTIKQSPTTYGITAVNSPLFRGTKSIRFELRDTDPMNNNGTRAEIAFPELTVLERWYGFALMFDADNYDYDSTDEIVMQWHQAGGQTPALCLRTKQDKIWIRIMGNIWIDLGNIEKGNWRKYVMHVIHASDGTGLIEIWKDGVNILTRSGQNMYALTSTVKKPTWKLGIYKSGWNDAKTTDTNIRVLYYDDIRLGNENAVYSDVVPIP